MRDPSSSATADSSLRCLRVNRTGILIECEEKVLRLAALAQDKHPLRMQERSLGSRWSLGTEILPRIPG